MIVKTIASGEFQSNFGNVADIAKSGEPVTITQYGRPTLMLISYQEGTELLRLKATQRLRNWFKERAETQPAEVESLSLDEINDLVHELRP